MTDQLTPREQLSMRAMHALNDEDLAGRMADLVDIAATNTLALTPHQLRDLAACAFIVARRMDNDRTRTTFVTICNPDPLQEP